MNTEKIEFRQVRDFGDIINATFAFISQNFRKLFLCILFIGGPFALLTSISLTFFQSSNIQAAKGNFTSEYFLMFGIYMFLFTVALVAVSAAVYYFIALYMEYDDFEISDVWLRVRKEIPVLVLFFFGYMIVVIFATFCLFIPGIYVSIAGALLFIVRLVERKGFFDCLSRSFKLISGHWWLTFGLLFVITIIQTLITYVSVAPLYILGYVFSLLDLGTIFMGLDASPLAIAIQAIQSIIGIICSVIIIVALIFHYFSLVEKKEGGGLMAKIRTMGTQPKTTSREEEEEEY
ncbi:MAG: hypothetical protein V4714_10610 [Bacteroidota bacterium]